MDQRADQPQADLDAAEAAFTAAAIAINQLAVVLRLQGALDEEGVRLWERLAGETIREVLAARGRPDLAAGLAGWFDGKASAEVAVMAAATRDAGDGGT